MTDKKTDNKTFKEFLESKNVIIKPKRYFHDSMYAMGIALFATLVTGLIFTTIGEQLSLALGYSDVTTFLIVVGDFAMTIMGPAIGIAIAFTLDAPMIVIVAAAAVGQMGAQFSGFGVDTEGGPGGAFLSALIAVEFGKLVYKETKLDTLVTPVVTLIVGGIVAKFAAPLVGFIMETLGNLINLSTSWHPFFSSIIIAVVMGLLLTFPPVSSAAFAIMLGMSGLAGGAATAGCCAQMVGFAACSYKVNGLSGFITQGFGTSMLQMSNIIRKPLIWIPPTITSAIMGPVSTCLFHMTNNPEGAGMGTSGLVGQIMTLADMGFTLPVFGQILLVHILMPAVIAIGINKIMVMRGYISYEDYELAENI